MPITVTDDQLREAEIAAGLKWSGVSRALGIEQPVVPIEEPVAFTGRSTYSRVKEKRDEESEGRQIHDGEGPKREGEGTGDNVSGGSIPYGELTEGQESAGVGGWFKR